jgi:hypothetical protein
MHATNYAGYVYGFTLTFFRVVFATLESDSLYYCYMLKSKDVFAFQTNDSSFRLVMTD